MNSTPHPTTITAQPGTQVLEVERTFDAPLELVFRAYTERDLVSRWLGPRRYEMVVDEWDCRSGGHYRYRHVDGASEHAFRGSFHTVEDGARIIQTFEYEGYPNEVSLESMTFTETDGRTVVRGRAVFPSAEALEAMIASGMEAGMQESYERLDELVAR